MPSPKLILASSSPRRRSLLVEAGYEIEVITPHAFAELESDGAGTRDAAALVAEQAYRKASDVARRVDCGPVVACDTVVECGGQILGKPADKDDARRMLRTLNGHEHRVFSGLCVLDVGNDPSRDAQRRQECVRVAVTTLRMDNLPNDSLEEYLDSHAWEGKAGAFGYQDRLGWVHIVDGSESNVVGLPLDLLKEMLSRLT